MAAPAASPRTFGALSEMHARVRPFRTALTFAGRETSYAALEAISNQIARALLAQQLRQGDRVAILAKNSDEYVSILLGCSKLGAVAVGLNWRLAAAELRYIINDSTASLLFVDPGFVKVVERLKSDLPALRQVVVLGDDAHEAWPALRDWLSNTNSEPLGNEIDPESAALQLYTSGTTGNPKGVVLPHRAFFDPWIYQDQPSMDWNLWREDDVSLLAMPLFHVGGIGLLFMALRGGATTVIAPEFDTRDVMALIAEHGVTRTFLVPAAIRALLLEPSGQRGNGSSLRYMLYGAAPMPEALLVEAIERFGCEFVQQYGMTEVSGTVVYLPPEDHRVGSPRLRAAGLPAPNVEIRILDRHGQPTKTGEVGEILLRTPATMLEYWRQPEATAKTLVDGYVYSGDAGYLDDEGYLYIFDRVKDMIISGGENIYPVEVENALYHHAAISDVAVIGIPDDKWGEAVTAIVVLHRDHNASGPELLQFCREHIAAYKIPKKIVFVDELPRNASGKILKKALREPFWEGRHKNV